MAIIDASKLPDHVVLDTDWDGYLRILDELEAQGYRPRTTYDRGKLEIMTVSSRHERANTVLGMLVEILLDALDRTYQPLGSVTIQRRDLDRGFEPDGCLWIANAKALPKDRELDMWRDPPPDLIVEVEVSRRILKRLPVFAAFRVPEVWRYTKKGELKILVLTEEGTYAEVDGSPTFPGFPTDAFVRHVHLLADVEYSEVKKRFRRFVQAWLNPA